MAEYVHQRMEEMLPELEEMNRAGLFDEEETKIILKKREGLEYRLRQKTKTKISYLNYISYEKKLLELLKVRRLKYGIDPKKRDIETAVIDRIQNLYRLLTTRFQEDVSLWEQHIDFCLNTGQTSYVTRLYEKILRIHSHREDMWIKAARFERSPDGNGNPAYAREILLKGHRVNPESQSIFLELYHMELDLASQILKRKEILGMSKQKTEESETDQIRDEIVLTFKAAMTVYKKALEIFPNQAKFHVKMFNICTDFKQAAPMLDTMANELKQLYPDHPYVWNGLAMRYLTGFKKMSKYQKATAIDNCVAVFKEALEKDPSESMWSCCLQGLVALLELCPTDNTQIQVLTLSLFQKAITEMMLTEELFITLMELLTLGGYILDLDRVSVQAVEHHPTSSKLWLARLKHMAEQASALKDILHTLRMALQKVPAEATWDIWHFGLNFFASRDRSTLETLMEKACRSSSPEVCQPAKEWCLTWTFRQGGIKKARNIYRRLKNMRPITVEFYRCYVLIEASQMEANLKLIRSAFEECLTQFGTTHTDVWLNYMEMEKTVAKDVTRSGRLQERALHNLNPNLKEDFLRQVTMSSVSA